MQDTIQTEFTVLDAKSVVLKRDPFNSLILDYEGTVWEKVVVSRPFPLSAPDRCIVFRSCEGAEIGFIASMSDLDEASRKIIDEELHLLYFTTRVTGINSVKSRHGVTTWDLETDHGKKTICVKDRNDIRSLGKGRILFTDTNGMRFEIPDMDKLDDKSQGFMESET